MSKRHSLLQRQLRKQFGGEIPRYLSSFIGMVDAAYHEFDADRAMVERSLELSSRELLQANSNIRGVLAALPDLYVLVNENDVIVDYQAGDNVDIAARAEQVIGGPIQTMALVADNSQLLDAIQRIRIDAGPVNMDFQYQEKERSLYLEARLFPVLGHQIAILFRDITSRKLAEKKLFVSERRLREQNRLIMDTAKSDYLNEGELERVYDEITATVAHGLHVQRVGVWLYNDDQTELVCAKLYERDEKRHSSGTALSAGDYPLYFDALRLDRSIVANNAHTHYATREFSESYLTPLGISSLLDAAINIGGRVVGVLCSEKVGSARQWAPEEIAFVNAMADFLSLAMETRERQKAQVALSESEDKFRILSETTDSIIVVFRDQFLYTNPAFQRISGYSDEELRQRGLVDLIHSDSQQIVEHLVAQYRQGIDENIREEIRIRDKQGKEHWLFLTSGLIQFEGKLAGLATAFDITERKQIEDQLRHQAFHDKLTGLPNRALFVDRLEHAVARANRCERRFAVLFIDIDRFKPINDSLGHLVGDKLLQEIAARLQRHLRAEDTITRLGGDEFTILLEGLQTSEYAILVAEKVQQVIAQPFVISGHEVNVTASIGIALGNDSDQRAENILRDADIAMYRAKCAGKGRYAIFDSAMHERALTLLQLEGDLRHAIEHHEFELYYQPIIELQTGRIHGFEALIRWNHPQRGLVPPVEFIPIAEEIGLITDIGDWVLQDACRRINDWQKKLGERPVPVINVNVSSKQLAFGDLVAKVAAVLQEHRVDGRSLKLELTESMVMENPAEACEIIEQLKRFQVRVAIDDFGTGYSSLSYLRRFSIDTLKIDRSFVSEIQQDGSQTEIVNTIVMLAHNLWSVCGGRGDRGRTPAKASEVYRLRLCAGLLFFQTGLRKRGLGAIVTEYAFITIRFSDRPTVFYKLNCNFWKLLS